MSALLPPIVVGRRVWRLPLSHGAAVALVAPSVERFGGVLPLDPPLALWLLAQAHRAGCDDLRTLPALAHWAAGARMKIDGAVLHEFDSAVCWRLAAQSVHAARGVGQADEAAYLAALVHAAPEWFAIAGARPGGQLPLPTWLRTALAGLRNKRSGRQAGEPDREIHELLRPLWLWPVAGPAELLIEGVSASDKQLEAEKLASLAELAAGAGHEINNPLAVISGRAQLLARDEPDPERRRELASIHAQAQRVHEMIGDLMLFARPPAAERKAIDAVKLVRLLAAELASAATERQTELVVDVPHTPLATTGDDNQLLIALRAVADNALQALGTGGRLSIALRRAAVPGWIEIELADTGPGIPPEIRRHIFDPFYSGRAAGRGLGFGLAKCWRIVTNHGGQIAVASQTGQGATFTISLPAATSKRTESGSPSAPRHDRQRGPSKP